MRITPIEKPGGPVMRLVGWLSQRQFGKSLTPWKVIFTRLPRAVPTQLAMYWGLEKGLPLDAELQLLIQSHVATMNGCSFCVDIGRAVATYRGATLEKLDAAPSGRLWATSRRRPARSASPTPRSRSCGRTSTIVRSSPSPGSTPSRTTSTC